MNQLTEKQTEELLQYIQHVFICTDHFNTKYTAYGLKQPFSRTHFYITTEQFIAAMKECGFKTKPIGADNAYFNISDHSLFEDLKTT